MLMLSRIKLIVAADTHNAWKLTESFPNDNPALGAIYKTDSEMYRMLRAVVVSYKWKCV